MEAAQIAFGNGARPDATGVGDLDQRHCFLRAQLDEWTVFQPTLPDRRRSSGANDRPGSGNGVSAGTVARAPWIAMEDLRERGSTAVGASAPVNRRGGRPCNPDAYEQIPLLAARTGNCLQRYGTHHRQ
jgi:hypothetical protein